MRTNILSVADRKYSWLWRGSKDHTQRKLSALSCYLDQGTPPGDCHPGLRKMSGPSSLRPLKPCTRNPQGCLSSPLPGTSQVPMTQPDNQPVVTYHLGQSLTPTCPRMLTKLALQQKCQWLFIKIDRKNNSVSSHTHTRKKSSVFLSPFWAQSLEVISELLPAACKMRIWLFDPSD